MSMTHTATLVVTDRLTGDVTARTIAVRVLDTRIEDEQGRRYDKALSGAQTGPHRLTPATHVRRVDLASLKPIVRPRVRL